MSDLFEHPMDLPVAAFVQREFIPGILSFARQGDLCGCGFRTPTALIADADSSPQLTQGILRRSATDLYQIGPGNMPGGAHDLVRQFAVVSQQQAALRVPV